jgi:hypothetical protein
VLIRASLWLLLASFAGAAEGQTARQPNATSGNELLQVCSAEGDPDFWFCLGYLTGFNQSIVALVTIGAMKLPYCPPKGFTNRQFRNVVVSYLRAYPEQLNQSAELLTLSALSTAYPCPKQ